MAGSLEGEKILITGASGLGRCEMSAKDGIRRVIEVGRDERLRANWIPGAQ